MLGKISEDSRRYSKTGQQLSPPIFHLELYKKSRGSLTGDSAEISQDWRGLWFPHLGYRIKLGERSTSKCQWEAREPLWEIRGFFQKCSVAYKVPRCLLNYSKNILCTGTGQIYTLLNWTVWSGTNRREITDGRGHETTVRWEKGMWCISWENLTLSSFICGESSLCCHQAWRYLKSGPGWSFPLLPGRKGGILPELARILIKSEWI